jgi:hypothetical protein
MVGKPDGLLPTPEVTFDKDGDHVVSAYLKLREGIQAIGSFQPDPEALVFFYVAEDGLPIGIRFLEPATGMAVCELVDLLAEGPAGRDGIGRESRLQYLTEAKEIREFVRALKKTLIGMEDRAEPDTCSR